MKIEGRIYSNSTHKQIPATIIASHPDDGAIGQIEILSGEAYTLEGDESYLNSLTLIFSSKGFTSEKRQGWELIQQPNIYLNGGQNVMMALAAGGIMLVALQKKKKQVGKLETKDVFPFLLIVGGILAYVVIRKILIALGILESQDSKDLDSAATNPNSFWNPNFWQTKPDNETYTNPITLTTATQYADEIYDAIGMWNDDEDAVKAVFRRCQSQATASFICYAFDQKYKVALLPWLRGGVWPQDRLSDADVNEINQYILRLPKY